MNKELYDQLDEGIWVTKGTRFLTHRKYKSIYNLLKLLNTVLAFLLIVISIYQIGGYQYQGGIYEKCISILSLIFAIYIFAMSFYLSILELKVKTIHDNATNLSCLLRKLKLATDDVTLNSISNEYCKLEKELNHDKIDYKYWCNEVKSSKHQNSWCEKVYYFLLWHLYSKFPLVLAGVGVIVLFKFF